MRPRVQVDNASDGGFLYWLARLYAFAALALLALALLSGVLVYLLFASGAPATPDLDRYEEIAAAPTVVQAGDGSLLGTFADEWRELVPFERIPEALVDAFLAAEDHEFFEHHGLYLKGIARAAWRNLVAGEFVQGGSTITQQVAKQFVGSEKTLSRKANEAIMARRLEARYSKPAILGVYLNHIYLGGGAYGVQAAARRYFSKNVWELDVGQMALLAGLARAPSRDSPLSNPGLALERRNEVLDKMQRFGKLTEEEADRWKGSELSLMPFQSEWSDTHPYFSEHVRREIIERFGREELMQGGLTVETTLWPWVDAEAARVVDYMTRKQDKRQGWRGPEANLDGAARDTFMQRALARYQERPAPGELVLGLVTQVAPREARVIVGDHVFRLPLALAEWASEYSAENTVNDILIADLRQALDEGDVVWVRRPEVNVGEFEQFVYGPHNNPRWVSPGEKDVPEDIVALEQTPLVQGALFTIDHETGYVLSMIGGRDFSASEFNRVTQACRQPGSTYKPIYYSLALAEGYGFDSLWNDKPRAEIDPVTGEVWIPVNHMGTVDTEVTLEYALTFSKNIPSVDIFIHLGGELVEAWARDLGFTSEIIADKALALGASCTYMNELSRAFAIFARHGRWLDLVSIKRVLDRKGHVVSDASVPEDPMLSPGARLDRVAATAGTKPRQAIPARAAFLTQKLLRNVVSHGYSSIVRQTGVPTAGKTGTSSDTMDLWFVAFTSKWLTSAWLGDDTRQRDLGKHDAAYMTAVPMWATYMAQVTRGQELAQQIPWEVPEDVPARDRGGQRGRTAASPMPLAPHKKVQTEEVPDGLDTRERRMRQSNEATDD